MAPFWLTIFLDLADAEHTAGLVLWRAITGYHLSPERGEDGEFATLVPPSGDDHLRIQRLRDAPSRVHLDLHVADLDSAIAQAEEFGAELLARPGHAVLCSPGGFLFCFVRSAASEPSPPAVWPDGHRSRVDQLCLDIPPAAYDEECRFWSGLTGWGLQRRNGSEFSRLDVPSAIPVRLLLQRLDEGTGPVRAHLDLATDNRAAEVRRLGDHGIEPVGGGPTWTTLRPKVGPALCVTDRDPDTGLLP